MKGTTRYKLDCGWTRQRPAELQYLLKLALLGLEKQAERQSAGPSNRDGQSRVAGRPFQAQRGTEAGSVAAVGADQGVMTPPKKRGQLEHSQ